MKDRHRWKACNGNKASNTMKALILYLAQGVLAVSVLAFHITACLILFGKTGALVYLGIQAAIAAWIVYEMIRAPVYDD